MAKRNGNREIRKPKQEKPAKAEAATSVSAVGTGGITGGRRR